MKNRMGILGAWLVLIHTAAFLFFWLTNTAFYAQTNQFLAKMLGARTDYMGICLVVTAMLALWSIYRLVTRKRRPRAARWTQGLSNWSYGILGVIFLLFFYGSFYMLFDESPSQKVRILQLLGYYRVILDPLLLLGAALLAADWLRRRQLGWKKAVPIVAVLGILWSLALAFPPIPVLRAALPDKPLLIAHRDAAALAPENTLAAAQLAADLGAFGQETDVQMSADGMLFLMHDDTLARTTDVEAVFPGREKQNAGTFTWAELSRLDAGSWFGQDDPFATIRKGKVDPEQVAGYAGEPIPSFQAWLAVIRESGQTFLYDVKSTGDDPAEYDAVYEASKRAIAQAGVGDQAWILVKSDQAAPLVRDIPPGAKLAFGVDNDNIPKAIKLKIDGYQVVNAEYTLPVKSLLDFKKYYWVNIYTVDEAWQYSRLWILGVDSTTTNQLTNLMALKKPLLSVPYIIYALILVVAGVIAIGFNRLRDRIYKK
jgi:glycerophosphoryl diester phosphodiesterase